VFSNAARAPLKSRRCSASIPWLYSEFATAVFEFAPEFSACAYALAHTARTATTSAPILNLTFHRQ